MHRPRLVPVLLHGERGLVKTRQFMDPIYVGDPVNVLRIFNEKAADEMVLIDILATVEKRGPNLRMIADCAAECFVPLCYGGGVSTLKHARDVLNCGVEKVVVNTASKHRGFVKGLAEEIGSQSVCAGIDFRRRSGHLVVVTRRGEDVCSGSLEEHVCAAAAAGAGEIILQDVDRDGMGTGYDLEVIRRICALVDIPVMILGGIGSLADAAAALHAGADAVGVGSMVTLYGPHRAVLVSYPQDHEVVALAKAR